MLWFYYTSMEEDIKLFLGDEPSKIFIDILKQYNMKDFSQSDYNIVTMHFLACCHYDILHKEWDSWTKDKDFAEIILLLRYGKNIQLSADIPQIGNFKVSIEKESLIQEIHDILEEYLYKRHRKIYGERSLIAKKSNYEEDDYLITHDELFNIFEKGQKEEDYEKKTKSRENKYIPRLGDFVSSMLEQYDSTYSKLILYDRYSLLGDFLAYGGHAPYSWEDWQVKDKNEKAKIVRNWIKSSKKLSEDEASGSQQE